MDKRENWIFIDVASAFPQSRADVEVAELRRWSLTEASVHVGLRFR